ncbi:MAG: DUF1349 domain-containing protein [Caldilineaceae bacterium]
MKKLRFFFTMFLSLLVICTITASTVFAQTENNNSTSDEDSTTPLFLPLITQSNQSVDNSNENSQISATSQQACVVCQALFHDNFQRRGIASDWSWVDPDEDVLHTTTARQGYLRLSTDSANGNNLAPGLMGAPRLLRPLSGDSFKISTQVEITPIHDYQGAGLLIWQDENHFIRLERGLGLNGQGVYFAKNDNGNFTYQFAATEVTALRLRLQRLGRIVVAWMKDDQTGWKVVGAVNALPSDDLQVGIIMVADFYSPPTTADFDYFAITTCSPDFPETDD